MSTGTGPGGRSAVPGQDEAFTVPDVVDREELDGSVDHKRRSGDLFRFEQAHAVAERDDFESAGFVGVGHFVDSSFVVVSSCATGLARFFRI